MRRHAPGRGGIVAVSEMESDSPRVTLEMLLEHREWLRRLALSVARDPSVADDLEQDAWIAAMHKPPREPRAIRGWFRQVVKNAFRERLRRDERRGRRERHGVRTGEEPSTADIVARAETQRLLVERVFELREPYRTTILLRYFEGLDSNEVGRRMDCPANTVRVRTARALRQLQSELDDAHESRAAWMVLLLPGLGIPLPDSLTAQMSSDTPNAASAQKRVRPERTVPMRSALRPLVVAGGLAAVALLALLSWQALSGPDAATDAETAEADVAVVDGQDENADSDRARGARTREVSASESDTRVAGATRITGEVRLADGDRPAVDVEVSLVGTAGVVTTARTDTQGRFALDGVEPALGFRVQAAASGLATAESDAFDLAPRETRHVDTLWLDRPSRAVVKVVDPTGRPAEGATVEVYAVRRTVTAADWRGELPQPTYTAQTDEAGMASVEDLALGSWTFRAKHPEHAPAGLPAQPLSRGGVELNVVLHLATAHSLEGTVYGADDEPLANAVLLMLPPKDAVPSQTPEPISPLRIETKTDEDGRYRFDALPHGHHSLSVLPEGGLACRIGVVEIPNLSEFDVRLDGGTLTGTVTERGTGRPLAGAVVRAGVWRRHSPTFLSATTDAEGNYTITVPLGGFVNGPPTGEGGATATDVHFQVSLEGYAMPPQSGRHQWQGDWVINGATTQWDVELVQAASMSGQVVGPEGPVAGADVTLELWHDVLGAIPYTARTDGDGRYEVPGVLPGRVRGFVRQEGLIQSPAPIGTWRDSEQPDEVTTTVPESGEATLDLRLIAGSGLRGAVRDAAGRGIGAVVVEAVGATRSRTTTTADGSFAIGGLTAGREYTLRFSRDGYADVRMPWTEGEAALEVELVETGRVSGRVLTPDETLPRGTFVQVAPASAALDGQYEIASIWTTAPRAPVSPSGTFELPIPWFEGAAAEGLVVRAMAPGLAPALSDRLPVELGKDVTDVELRLTTGHTLEGVVVAADGSGPIAGARIEFANAELPPALEQARDWSLTGLQSHPFEWKAVTDAEGRFRLTGLPPWRYELRISAKGFHGTMPAVEVPGEDELRAELTATRSLAGSVRFADGGPAGGVEVRAHASGGGVAGRATADDDGAFEIPWLSEGEFRLEVRSRPDRPVDVVPFVSEPYESDSHDVELVVERAEGRIEGRCVTHEGAVVPGAWVTVKPMDGSGQPVSFRSAMDGRFALTGLSGGPFTVIAVANRSAGGPENFGVSLTVERDDVALGTRDLPLVFTEALPLAGTIRRSDGSPPGGALTLRAVRRPDGRWTRMAGVAGDGSFQIQNLLPGEYHLSLIDQRTGVELRMDGATSFAAGDEEVRLVVAAAGRLHGVVTGADGEPEPQVWVRAVGPSGRQAWTRSAADGTFELEVSDPAAAYRVEAIHHEQGNGRRLDARPGGEAVQLTLRPLAALTFRVVDTEGTPLRSATLLLAPESGGPMLEVRTDAEGRVSSRGLPEDGYTVHVRDHAGRRLPAPVACGSVRSGEAETTLRVEL